MTSSKTNGSLNSTEDYSIFSIREDNRKIESSHVARLVASLKAHNDLYLNPIIVNSDLEVIDGQHRLKAAQKVGVPIYYVVDDAYTPEKMIIFNTTQKQWKPDDYLNYWINHGRVDYRKLRDFKEDLGFPLSAMLKWVSAGGGKSYSSFKRGAFTFKLDDKLLQGLLACKRLIGFMKARNFKPINVFRQGAFHEACRNLFTNPLIDLDRFFARLEVVPFQIRYSQLWQEYLDQLVEIYNYDMRRDRVRVIQDGQKRELSK